MYCREWVIYMAHYSTADYLLIEKYIAHAINKKRILTPKMYKHHIYFFFFQITQKKLFPSTKLSKNYLFLKLVSARALPSYFFPAFLGEFL
jgi:hypothetical protein